ncbi:putative ABC amino acid transporter solute binding protein [Marinomonas sp. MED121]|nr:putative ABC amino acid transporter solute binding protein [Marinomonas sp. MED121]
MKPLAPLVLILSTTLSCYADDDIQVVTENLKPLNYLEGGEVKGTATRLVRMVLKEAGLTANFQVYPWARAYAMAQHDKNTLIYTINRTAEREAKFQWIGLLASEEHNSALYRLKTNPHIRANTLEDAKKYAIGVNFLDVNHEILKSEGFTNINAVSERSQSIKMLMRNRIDLILGSYPVLVEAFNALGQPIEKIEKLISFKVSRPYMAMSNKTPKAMVEKVRKAYQDLLEAGEIPRFKYQAPELGDE